MNQEVLKEWMNHLFILREPPKTTGREEFGLQFVQEYLSKYTLSAED